MNREISFYQIFSKIWSGRKLITWITLVSLLLAIFLNLVIRSPLYEASSYITFGNQLDSENNLELYSYLELAKSEVVIQKVLRKLGYDQKIAETLANLEVEILEKSNTIRVRVTDPEPKTAEALANAISYETAYSTEISDRQEIIIQSKVGLEELGDNISVISEDLQKTKSQLKETPEKIITKKSLSEDPYLLSVAGETSQRNAAEIGALSLTNEELNPVYINLKQKESDLTIEVNHLKAQEKVLQEKILENEQLILDLREAQYNSQFRVFGTRNELNNVFVTSAIEPSVPVNGDRLVNSVLIAVLMFILSSLYVFIRETVKEMRSQGTFRS